MISGRNRVLSVVASLTAMGMYGSGVGMLNGFGRVPPAPPAPPPPPTYGVNPKASRESLDAGEWAARKTFKGRSKKKQRRIRADAARQSTRAVYKALYNLAYSALLDRKA